MRYWSESIQFNDDPNICHAVCTKASDGAIDVVAEFPSRDLAREAASRMNREYEQSRFDEARYQAMYDHACGYYD